MKIANIDHFLYKQIFLFLHKIAIHPLFQKLDCKYQMATFASK